MTHVFVKLAFSGLRRRRLQTALTMLVVAASTAALTVALGVDRIADRPWERTFAATNGPHVMVMAPSEAVDLGSVVQQPEVVDSSSVPWISTTFRHDGKRFGLTMFGVGAEPPRVARPLLDEGSWPGAGQAALERSFARFLGLAVGDRLVVGGGVPIEVSGIVVIPKSEPYPTSQPGQAFALEETLARVAPDRSRWAQHVNLRLADPEGAGTFIDRLRTSVPGPVFWVDWRDERAEAKEELLTVQVVLGIFSVLLLLAGGFVLATLLGGRVLAQVREIGVLKAAGLTPGQVARVFVIEQLALGFAGSVAGIALGTLATPLVVSRSAALLNTSEIPPFEPARAVLVLTASLLAVAAFTFVPSWKTGRRTTGSILSGAGALGVRRSRLARLPLPLTISLGLREAFLRPGRALLTMLALALTVASVTATLGMEASFNVESSPVQAIGSDLPPFDPVDDDAGEEATLRPIVYGLDAVLLFVGAVNLLATVLLGLRERVRDLGLLKAVGLTPRQVAGTFVASQAALAAGAVAVGIPLGLGLFRWAVGATGGTDEFAYPTWWWLALLGPAVIAVVVLLAAPLARRAAQVSVADALRYE